MTAPGEDQFGRPLDAFVAGGSIDLNPPPNRSAVIFETVTIVSAGTPVQGPDISVPDDFALAYKVRPTLSGSPKGFVGTSQANVGSSADRQEYLKGEGISLFLDNFNRLWFDADTDGTVFELFVEQ